MGSFRKISAAGTSTTTGTVHPNNVTLGVATFNRQTQELSIPWTLPSAPQPTKLLVLGEFPSQANALAADGSTAFDGTRPAVGTPQRADLGYHSAADDTVPLRIVLPEPLKAEMTARIIVVAANDEVTNDLDGSPTVSLLVGPPEAVKIGSGVEYGPLVQDLAGVIHTEQRGANWVWWFELTWQIPIGDPRISRVLSWNVVLFDPSIRTRRDDRSRYQTVHEAPKTTNQYTLPDVWTIPDEPVPYRIYIQTMDEDRNLNQIVPSITPYVEFTPVKGIGDAGTERAGKIARPIILDGPQYVRREAQIKLELLLGWSKPSDPRYGGVTVYVQAPGEAAPGHPASGVETGVELPISMDYFPAETALLWFYFLSVDQNNLPNTYVDGVTPKVSVAIPAAPSVLGDGLTDTGSGIRGAHTDTSNLLANPTFESDQQLAHWDPNDADLVTWGATAGMNSSGGVLMEHGSAMINGDRIPCKPGDSFVGKVWARNAGGADGTLRVVLGFLTSAEAGAGTPQEVAVPNSQTSYAQSAGVVATAPSNAAYVFLQLITNSTTGTWAVDTASLRRQTDTDSIQDGAISDIVKFGADYAPTVMWAGVSLPSVGVPDDKYPTGILLIWLTSSAKHYRRKADNTWEQVLQPADMATGTLAVGVAYAGSIIASQVTSGMFTGRELELIKNGVRTRITNDYNSSGPVPGYAGVLVDESPSGDNLTVVMPGLVLTHLGGVVNSWLGASQMGINNSFGDLGFGIQIQDFNPYCVILVNDNGTTRIGQSTVLALMDSLGNPISIRFACGLYAGL